jgi:hypothetical protein
VCIVPMRYLERMEPGCNDPVVYHPPILVKSKAFGRYDMRPMNTTTRLYEFIAKAVCNNYHDSVQSGILARYQPTPAAPLIFRSITTQRMEVPGLQATTIAYATVPDHMPPLCAVPKVPKVPEVPEAICHRWQRLGICRCRGPDG